MSIVDQLRKGFGYMLMCMGVSRPAAKPKPPSPPPPQPPAGPPPAGSGSGK